MLKFFPWKRALRRKTVWFSLIVMLFFGWTAVFAPWIAPYDPYEWRITESDIPPMWVQDRPKPGRQEFPLGTDYYGRDILSRLVMGARTALLLALIGVGLAAVTGTLVGLTAGVAGGKLDAWMMFITDILQSLPGIMFMVIVILIFRGLLAPSWLHGMLTLIAGYAAVSWVSLARQVRVEVLILKTEMFVEAATALGASRAWIVTRHLLPNVMHVILVWVINNIPAVILLEAVLGYIGVGVTSAIDGGEFTTVSWGGLFLSGRTALNNNPMMLVLPSMCILLISMSFILLGDFLNGISRPGWD